jgi:hypothetical protein
MFGFCSNSFLLLHPKFLFSFQDFSGRILENRF